MEMEIVPVVAKSPSHIYISIHITIIIQVVIIVVIVVVVLPKWYGSLSL